MKTMGNPSLTWFNHEKKTWNHGISHQDWSKHETCWFDGDLAMKHRDFCQLLVDMGVSEKQDAFEIGNFILPCYKENDDQAADKDPNMDLLKVICSFTITIGSSII
jgi:hypothetical protein